MGYFNQVPENPVNPIERHDWLIQAAVYQGIKIKRSNGTVFALTSNDRYQATIELLSLPDPPYTL